MGGDPFMVPEFGFTSLVPGGAKILKTLPFDRSIFYGEFLFPTGFASA
jgi:hypothetical protein